MHLLSTCKKSVFCTLFAIFILIQSHQQSKIPDIHVTCLYSEDCILPCTFHPSSGEAVFHWYKQGTLIYSFPEDKDDSINSNISVFTGEVSHGNASLLLEDSSIKSRGQYKCVVNTTDFVHESDVIVKVEAPINGISIVIIPAEHVQCSSHGVYPAPLLKWSTDPSFAQPSLQSVTRMSADSNDLYSIASTVKKIGININITYICSITSKYSSQSWRASLLQTEMTVHFGQQLLIPCMAPKNLENLTLTWTFITMNTHRDILSYYNETHRIQYHRVDQGELDLYKALMGNGSLYLKNFGSKHSGIYVCTFTGFQVKHIVQTLVKIHVSKAIPQAGYSGSKLWMSAIIVAALALPCVIFCIYNKYKVSQLKHYGKDTQQDTEMQAMHKDNSVEELPNENNTHAKNNKKI